MGNSNGSLYIVCLSVTKSSVHVGIKSSLEIKVMFRS